MGLLAMTPNAIVIASASEAIQGARAAAPLDRRVALARSSR
jgi:hypothetical protein